MVGQEASFCQSRSSYDPCRLGFQPSNSTASHFHSLQLPSAISCQDTHGAIRSTARSYCKANTSRDKCLTLRSGYTYHLFNA